MLSDEYVLNEINTMRNKFEVHEIIKTLAEQIFASNVNCLIKTDMEYRIIKFLRNDYDRVMLELTNNPNYKDYYKLLSESYLTKLLDFSSKHSIAKLIVNDYFFNTPNSFDEIRSNKNYKKFNDF